MKRVLKLTIQRNGRNSSKQQRKINKTIEKRKMKKKLQKTNNKKNNVLHTYCTRIKIHYVLEAIRFSFILVRFLPFKTHHNSGLFHHSHQQCFYKTYHTSTDFGALKMVLFEMVENKISRSMTKNLFIVSSIWTK